MHFCSLLSANRSPSSLLFFIIFIGEIIQWCAPVSQRGTSRELAGFQTQKYFNFSLFFHYNQVSAVLIFNINISDKKQWLKIFIDILKSYNFKKSAEKCIMGIPRALFTQLVGGARKICCTHMLVIRARFSARLLNEFVFVSVILPFVCQPLLFLKMT